MTSSLTSNTASSPRSEGTGHPPRAVRTSSRASWTAALSGEKTAEDLRETVTTSPLRNLLNREAGLWS
ncbi:hypothetical protein GCM10009678_69530 [Actinomadura kijaniata]